MFTAEEENGRRLVAFRGDVPFGGGCVMVWIGISGQERTPLVIINGNLTARRYIDDILRCDVLPFLEQQPRGVVYQHDNPRPHTARIVQKCIEVNNVNVLPWPAYSPDVSPIETLMDRLVRQQPHLSTANQLELEREKGFNVHIQSKLS